MYGYFHWEDPLPWESKKNNTSIFNDSNSSMLNKQEAVSIGPSTLRKVVGPINVKVIEAARKRLPELTTYSYYTSDEYVEHISSPSRNNRDTRTTSNGNNNNNGNYNTGNGSSNGNSGSGGGHGHHGSQNQNQNSFLAPSNHDNYKNRSNTQSVARPATGNGSVTGNDNGSVYSGYEDDSNSVHGSQYGNNNTNTNGNNTNTNGNGNYNGMDTNSVASSGTTDTTGSWGSFLSNVASTVTATASSAISGDTDTNQSQSHGPQARQTPAGRGMQREKSMFMKVSSMFGK